MTYPTKMTFARGPGYSPFGFRDVERALTAGHDDLTVTFTLDFNPLMNAIRRVSEAIAGWVGAIPPAYGSPEWADRQLRRDVEVARRACREVINTEYRQACEATEQRYWQAVWRLNPVWETGGVLYVGDERVRFAPGSLNIQMETNPARLARGWKVR